MRRKVQSGEKKRARLSLVLLLLPLYRIHPYSCALVACTGFSVSFYPSFLERVPKDAESETVAPIWAGGRVRYVSVDASFEKEASSQKVSLCAVSAVCVTPIEEGERRQD